MRICYICPEYPIGPQGGIGTFTQLIARELVKNGHSVRVIGVYKHSYCAPDYEEDFGVKVWRLRESNMKFGWVAAWIKQYWIIKKWAKNNEIDIVEAPDSRGWYALWKKFPVPLVLRFHGSQTFIAHILHKKVNRLTYLFESMSYQRADALVSVSYFNEKATRNLFSIHKKIAIIHNGLNFQTLSQIDRKKNVIVFSGTLNTFKGFSDFLDALLLLANQVHSFEVHIYGKDAYLDNKRLSSELITELSENSILKGKINYHGHVSRDELFEVYQQASVAVFPSHVEAFGLAPLEAMMFECPVIFTNNTTGNELIDNGTNALLVSPNKPDELKNAILQIFNNPDDAAKMGKNAREHVISKFDLQVQVKKNIDFYTKVLYND